MEGAFGLGYHDDDEAWSMSFIHLQIHLITVLPQCMSKSAVMTIANGTPMLLPITYLTGRLVLP